MWTMRSEGESEDVRMGGREGRGGRRGECGGGREGHLPPQP